VIDLAPRRRPQPLPAGGLLADVGLGTLARRLRLLGLDVGYSTDARDAELVERAAAEDRMVLTQDRGLLMRRALWVSGQPRGALVRGSGPERQLADVLDRFAPPLAPRTRCTACGGPLRPGLLARRPHPSDRHADRACGRPARDRALSPGLRWSGTDTGARSDRAERAAAAPPTVRT
jgi:hypothetical protein